MITVTAVGKAAHGAATGLIAARRPAVSPLLGCLGVVSRAAVSAVVLHISNGSTDLTTWWYGGLALAVTMLVPGLLVAGKQRQSGGLADAHRVLVRGTHQRWTRVPRVRAARRHRAGLAL